MIYPYLTYCNVIWANTYSTRLRSIFMLQKKIVRIITFSNYTEESRPLFKSLKILDIYELNTYLTGIFMYWYYHGNLPAYFINFFVQNESIHSYNTRSATKYTLNLNEQIMQNFLSGVKERRCGTSTC